MQAIEENFTELKIVGMYTPPFRILNEREKIEIIHLINKAAPAIAWVGLSTPKQEYFMAQYLQHLNTTLMIGVGAAFDFHSGRKPQAPYWIPISGFEWLFCLIQNPGHL